MGVLTNLYKPSLGLLTDLYQLTMAYGYFRAGLQQRQAVFHLFFRRTPFRGGFTIAAGLATAVEFLVDFRFEPSDIEYLSGLRGNDDQRLFRPAFLDFLQNLRLECDVDAIPEGTVVFPHEPLLRVRGPLIQAQLLETALLNVINFQTLIATKAARMVMAAGDAPVLEFGLRRAQGVDGALAASRAAYLGGCAGTSNVLAGRLYGIPVRGTHAHSWVMCFESELDAFRAYAAAMPNNCVFLVDTYDTLQGVRSAVEVGQWLRQRGHEMVGIRLDSGDLAALSAAARRILDEAGFPQAVIIASGDLDEYAIEQLRQRGAPIGVWGVGTRLATAYDQPALDGVYKLSAVCDPGQSWQDRIKISEEPGKGSHPGILQVRRFYDGPHCLADVIFDQQQPIQGECVFVEFSEGSRPRAIPADTPSDDLLLPVFRDGRQVYDPPPLEECRGRAQRQLAGFRPQTKRLANPQSYPVGLEIGLYQREEELRGRAGSLASRGAAAGRPPA